MNAISFYRPRSRIFSLTFFVNARNVVENGSVAIIG